MVCGPKGVQNVGLCSHTVPALIYTFTMVRRISIALLMCISGAVRGADFRPAELDRIIENTRKAWNVPGVAVAIVHGDDIVYMKGFGVKRVGSTDPVTPDTLFAICSSTKAFTSAALGILVDERKVGWDDSVRKHLPYFKLSDPWVDANVTIRDLLCHRAGLANNGDLLWVNISASREEIIRKIALLPLSYSFRSSFHYNNIAFIAAGEVVGHVAGTTWEEFVNRRLLMPLGMTNTNFSASDALKSPDHATPHRRREEEIEPIDWPKLDQIEGGQLHQFLGSRSDALDASSPKRWGNSGVRSSSRKPPSAKRVYPQMAMPFPNLLMTKVSGDLAAYGLGSFSSGLSRSSVSFHDPGGFDGWHSMSSFCPKERPGELRSSCRFPSSKFPLRRTLPSLCASGSLDELLGLPAKDPNPSVLARRRQGQENIRRQIEQDDARRRKDTKPSLALAEYAGTYDHPAFGTVQVAKAGASWNSSGTTGEARTNHHNFDTFRVSAFGWFPGSLAQFRLTPNSNVRSILFSARNTIASSEPRLRRRTNTQASPF